MLLGCGSSPSDDDGARGSTTTAATTTIGDDAGAGASTSAPTTTTEAPGPVAELPRGGTEIFPAFRVVAQYGNAQAPVMGVLGEVPPEQAAARVQAAADPFATPDRPVLPAFELIVTVAQGAPGPTGTYSTPTPMELVRPWLEAARAADMLLVLDLQPGTGDFLTDARRFEELLRQPDVGLALDPEWRMAPGQVPGQVVGGVDAAEVNEVSAWLAAIVAEERLPQKLFVIHRFTDQMVRDADQVEDRPGLATVFHVDGFGGRSVKLRKLDQLRGPYWTGFKLFLDEDTDLFQPAEVLALPDPPDLVTYQ
ncbi:hypothetical protein HC251_03215 [Iamia sp. SCSIO 61187]|nr:hypothetical protein HC251_03215 [Iamia sp. SCSIO 61187]